MDLIERLDAYLAGQPKRKTKKRWYATDLLKCGRQLFYKKTNEEPSEETEAGALWKMEMGNILHEKIYEFVKAEIDPDAQAEVKLVASSDKAQLYDKFPAELDESNLGKAARAKDEDYDEDWESKTFGSWLISGYVDIVYTENGVKKAIENKTSFGRGIKNIQQLGEPKDDHLAQCICYLSLTDIEEINLFYFGRDNAYRTVFKVWLEDGVAKYAQSDTGHNEKTAPNQFNPMLERLRGLEIQIDQGVMPPRDFQAAIVNGEVKDKFVRGKVEYKTDWQCNYCDYKRLCWIDQMMKYAEGDNRESFQRS
jgi:CRISPR/Cas system-associated exonuclease Cas4 (RecB family)